MPDERTPITPVGHVDVPPELSEQADKLILLVERLTAALEESAQDLKAYGRHNRLWIRGLIASFIIQAVLFAGVTYAVRQNRETQNAAARAVLVACSEANVVRAKSIIMWEEVYRLQNAPTAGEAPLSDLDVKRIQDFRAFVAETFKPSDCGSLL